MSKIVSAFRNIRWKYYINYIAIGIVAILFTALSLSDSLPSSTIYLLENITIRIILAVSLGLVVGFLGELSLGHAGFMCIGAYIGGKLASIVSDAGLGNTVPTMIIAIVAGALVAALAGLIVGLPALRLKGDYLAIVTLAFGEIVKTVFENSDSASFGGPMGLRTPRFDKQYLFIIGFVMILLTLAVIQNLIRSKHGRAITAIRDNEIAAKATGISVTKYKLVAFILSAAFAGVAGVVYSYSTSTVSAATFDYNYSIEILVMVVLGGMGNISGSIISATLVTFINTQLQSVLTGELAVMKDIIYALILIILIIYNNAPALKKYRERYNLRALLDKLVKKRPENKYADDDVVWGRVPTKIDMDEVLSTEIIVKESVQRPDKEERSDG